jgi:mono/diheme cytochrome c family protein
MTIAQSYRKLLKASPALVALSAWVTALSVFFCPSSVVGQLSPADFQRGQTIFEQSCAGCHGEKAEGVQGVYDSPLIGDLPVKELSRYVDLTMPEGDPEECAGADAELVTAYLYQAFYSREAQLRNNPPKIEFSRRTVGQYQNSIRDIVKAIRGTPWVGEERGFRTRYYSTRELGKGKPAIERLEPTIDFDFGDKSPDAQKLTDPKQFSIAFDGGLIIEETGTYEFIVSSKNGFFLSCNGIDRFIDNKVNSPDQNEFRATMRLDAGEVYPIALEMIKFNDPTANLKLEWVKPSGIREVIPARSISNGWFHPMIVLNTKFPADDSSIGYARGTSISDQWDSATTRAAMETMNFFERELDSILDDKYGRLRRRRSKLTPEQHDAKDHQRHLDFAVDFAEAALGHALTEQERAFFVDRQFEIAKSDLAAVKRTILLTLKSPQFLYLTCFKNDATPHDIANRLSIVLWDSLPDEKLKKLAAEEKLSSHRQVSKAAWEMLHKPRTKQKLSEFFFHWLEMEKASHASKDEAVYPGFGQELIESLKNSIDLSLNEIVWSDEPDFRELLLFDQIYIDRRMADFYGIEKTASDGFEKVSFESDRRSGVLTHPYLMTGLAYYKNTSPIHRGVFVAKSLLGRSLKPPPIDVEPLEEAFDPTMTTRERVTHQTKEIACSGCHSVINPLGFSLENYDAVGRFRDTEKDKPIDSKTVYLSPTSEEVVFNGAKDLANYLVQSPEAHRNFIEKLFEHFVKQPIYAFGPDVLDRMQAHFEESNFNVQSLIVEIAIVAATHDVDFSDAK